MLSGIDISSHQASLNLDAISYDFVMIKATQGIDYVNPYCDQQYQEAKGRGKKIAVYHYADGHDATQEANWFVDNCQGYLHQAIFVLDWEGKGVEYINWALTFLQRVEARIGYRPAIYMSESVENSYDWSKVVSGDYGLWLAKYSDYEIDNNYDTSQAGQSPQTKYWPFYFMWQWTSKGRLSGYAGDLDCDIAYLTPEQWDRYAGVPAPLAPAPQSDPPLPAAPTTASPAAPSPATAEATPTVTVPDSSPDPTPVPSVVPSDPPRSSSSIISNIKEFLLMDISGFSKAVAGGLVTLVVAEFARYGVHPPVDVVSAIIFGVVTYVIGHLVVFFAPANK